MKSKLINYKINYPFEAKSHRQYSNIYIYIDIIMVPRWLLPHVEIEDFELDFVWDSLPVK